MSPHSTNVSAFGAYLLDAMKAAGYAKPNLLAKATGVSHANIGRWIEGTATPSIDALRRIAPSLQVPLGNLVVAAGILTATELPTGPAAPLPKVVRSIMSRLGPTSPLTEKGQIMFQLHLERMIDAFDAIATDAALTYDPQMRGRR